MVQVGLFCSSNKPHLWGDLIKTLSNNSVDWNLCIAGPYPPVALLPGNVKYIQTNVKPAQCFFIAEYNTKGDYVMCVSDDITLTPGSLDDLVSLVKNDKIIASCKYSRTTNIKNAHYLLPDKRIPKSKGQWKMIILDFPLPTGALLYRTTFDSIGIDQSFIGLWWDQDIYIEFVSRGGTVIMSDKSIISDLKTSGLCKGCGDYVRMMDMWVDGDKIRKQRKELINPMVYSSDILTVSQGNKYFKWT